MSAQRLSDRSLRRIANATGLDLVRGWGHGGYVHAFVTADHEHGWYDTKSREYGFDKEPVMHYSSCRELFPGFEPTRAWRPQ